MGLRLSFCLSLGLRLCLARLRLWLGLRLGRGGVGGGRCNRPADGRICRAAVIYRRQLGAIGFRRLFMGSLSGHGRNMRFIHRRPLLR